MLSDETLKKIKEAMDKDLPSIIRVSKLGDYPVIPFSRGTLRNELSAGTGPASFTVGGSRCVFKPDLIDWTIGKIKE